MWLALAILVTGIAALAWLITSRALLPVSQMVTQLRGITPRILDERVPETHSCDEIDELAKTMNGMLDRIEAGIKRQRQFVSDASHELRSPITAITSEAEIALSHPEVADWKVLAKTSYSEGKRLERLVGDLLALATASEERFKKRETINLDDLLFEEVKRINRLPVRTSGVSAAQVWGNADQLSRLVHNLLSNASRHATSLVAVELYRENGQALLGVDDNGCGIAAEDRERVFERFARLEAGRSRDSGGTGLGLAVVRAMALAHGGDVSVTDSPLGGARFEVKLPLGHVERTPHCPAVDRKVTEKKRPRGDARSRQCVL